MSRTTRSGRASVAGGGQAIAFYDSDDVGDGSGYVTVKAPTISGQPTSINLGSGIVIDGTTKLTLWDKGVMSIGDPTAAQKAFMASYTGGDLSGFPGGGTVIAAGASGAAYAHVSVEVDRAPNFTSDNDFAYPETLKIRWSDGDRYAEIDTAYDASNTQSPSTADAPPDLFAYKLLLKNSDQADLATQVRLGGTVVAATRPVFNGTSFDLASVPQQLISGTSGDDASLTAPSNPTSPAGNLIAAATELAGLAGNDTLTGSNGVVTMIGGAGADTLNVGSGPATIVFQAITDSTAAAPDVIHGLKSSDTIDISALTATGITFGTQGSNFRVDVATAAGTLTFLSDKQVQPNQIYGSYAHTGTSGNDTITGIAGKSDIITGGGGGDTLNVGATGSAVFRYTAVGDSTTGSGATDTIHGFRTGIDRIDASALTATGFLIDHGSGGAVVTVHTSGGDLVIDVANDGSIAPDDVVIGHLSLQATTDETALYGSAGGDTLIAAPGHAGTVLTPLGYNFTDGTPVSFDNFFVAPETSNIDDGGTANAVAEATGTLPISPDDDAYDSSHPVLPNTFTFTTTSAHETLDLALFASDAFASTPVIQVLDPNGNTIISQDTDPDYAPFTSQSLDLSEISLPTAGKYTILISEGFRSFYSSNVPVPSVTTIDTNDVGDPYTLTVSVTGGTKLEAAQANVGTHLYGGAGNDVLVSGSGSDVLDGGGGSNIASYANAAAGVTVDLTHPQNTGDGSDDLIDIQGLIGSAFADTLIGNGGANILLGGGGADTMKGGAGNDDYYVDNAGDTVIEAAGGGNDTVHTSVNYTLGAGQEIESLVTTSTAANQPLSLTGNEFVNTLVGNGQANYLDGKGGADSMIGGAGDDTYFVDNAADHVYESVGGGYDRVLASVSYTLAPGREIERLTTDSFTGTAAINLIGNEFDNLIQGNAGANLIDGGLGDDTLYGFGGADTFLFNTKLGNSNVDRIADFANSTNAVHDRIELIHAVFATLPMGNLAATAFKDIGVAGAKVDADDHILYNHNNGALYYDDDGSGHDAAILFAVLSNHVTLSAADFIIG